MGVVDEQHQWSTVGRLDDQPIRCEGDVEGIRLKLGGDPECRLKGMSLRGRQSLGEPDDRAEQLMQASERELRLRLDSRCRQDQCVPLAGARSHVAEQSLRRSRWRWQAGGRLRKCLPSR
jgi:hypothetical protein